MTQEARPYSLLKFGMLITASVWFLFSFYELFKCMVNIGEYASFTGPTSTWVLITDVSGAVGLIARTIAGLIAVIAVAVYVIKGGLLASTTTKIIRSVVAIEAVYWLSLLLAGIWGVLPADLAGVGSGLNFDIPFLVETGVPCLIASIALPVALFKIVYELRPSGSSSGALKWGLIAGTLYVFVFWLENTGNWVYTVMAKGAGYITAYPQNMFSFLLTTFGLLVIAVYAGYFTKRSIGAESPGELDLKIVGVVMVLVGLYFLWNYLTWIYFGNNQLWSDWYAWFLGHNMDLWVLAIPLVGLPLMFVQGNKRSAYQI